MLAEMGMLAKMAGSTGMLAELPLQCVWCSHLRLLDEPRPRNRACIPGSRTRLATLFATCHARSSSVLHDSVKASSWRPQLLNPVAEPNYRTQLLNPAALSTPHAKRAVCPHPPRREH
jgi:hypothetical protein